MTATTQVSDETTLQAGANQLTLIRQYSPKEVAEHNTLDDIWIIVDCGVYDLTNFLNEHLGGEKGIS